MPGWTSSVLAKEANSTASQSTSEQVDIEDIESEYISDFELVDVPEDPPPDPELVKVIQDEEYTNGRMAFLFGQYEAAYKIWLPLAEKGYAKAQATIAWMYHTGKGVKKDLDVAFDWYEKAAKQNNPIAQNNVGVFYEQGLSVGKSSTNAAKWYREAAEWGYPYAQYNLGTLYLEGRGVKRDEKEAQFWLQIAALQGVEQAIVALQKLSPESHKKLSTGTKTISVKKSPHTTPHGSSNYKDMYNRIKTTNTDPGGFDYGGSLSPPTSGPSSQNKTIAKADQNSQSKSTAQSEKPVQKSRSEPAKQSTSSNNTQGKTVTAKELLPGQKFDKWLADAQAAQAHLQQLGKEKSTNSHSLKVFNDEWVREQNPTNYTLQIARSDQLDWLLNVAKKQPMLKDTAYYTTVVDGKKWFYLIYGNFTNRESANEEIQKLPKALKKWSPWIRQFSDLQSSMTLK